MSGRKSFSNPVAKMSPEAQARVAVKTAALEADIPCMSCAGRRSCRKRA